MLKYIAMAFGGIILELGIVLKCMNNKKLVLDKSTWYIIIGILCVLYSYIAFCQ